MRQSCAKLRDDLKKTNKMLADRDAEVARERNTAPDLAMTWSGNTHRIWSGCVVC
ncbi:MAG: hypothetical protein WDM89_12155 [Rhizomicrobium sp.]